jgi:hypothetical protein
MVGAKEMVGENDGDADGAFSVLSAGLMWVRQISLELEWLQRKEHNTIPIALNVCTHV